MKLEISLLAMLLFSISKVGGIPYTAHGAQITPPLPYIWFSVIFVCMLILGKG